MADFFAEIGNFFSDLATNILEFLWDLFETLIHLLFGWINIPAFPQSLEDSVNNFLDLIFENLNLLDFFIRFETLRIIIPLFLFMINFKYIYKLVMWLIRKIPFLGME